MSNLSGNRLVKERVKLLLGRHFLKTTKKESINEIEDGIYSFNETIHCVDARHFDEDGDFSGVYTWYIPTDMVCVIEKGDLLVVEQLNGTGISIVVAESGVYGKDKETHIQDLHPTCKVFSVLKQKYQDLNMHIEEDEEESFPSGVNVDTSEQDY